MGMQSLFGRAASVAAFATVLFASSAASADPPVRDRVDPAKDEAKDTIRDAREKARDAVRDSRREVRDTTQDAAREAREARREARRATRQQLGISFGRVAERGLAIAGVAVDSLLAQSGLRKGDHVVSVNGQPVNSDDDFDRHLYAGDPDDKVKVVVFRDGQEVVVNLEPKALYVDTAANDLGYFGVVLDDQITDRIVIRDVRRGTPAFAAGLRAGDEITTWHGQPIASPRDFALIIQRTEPGSVEFEYLRDAKTTRAEAKFERREEKREERRSR